MIKSHRIPLYYYNSSRSPVVLTYSRKPLHRSQARLVGREALVPDIALDAYSCSAVIDWVRLHVHLGRVTQHQWLRDAFAGFDRHPFIEPVAPGEGKESAQFLITVQEPELCELERILAAIDRKYGLISMPTVVGIEVSVDFTPKEPSDDARARMVGVLSRHLAHSLNIFEKPKEMPRYSWGSGHRWSRIEGSRSSPRDSYRFAVVDFVSTPGADTTIYFGAKTSDVMVRVMDKVLDRQNTFAGTQELLPSQRQRARIEVTLRQGKLEELGIRHLRDVRSFRFATLQRLFFQFKLATAPTNVSGPAAAFRERKRVEKFLSTGVSGLAKMDQASSAHSATLRSQVRRDLQGRGSSLPSRSRIAPGPYGTAVAYEQLCTKVQTALANLSRALMAKE